MYRILFPLFLFFCFFSFPLIIQAQASSISNFSSNTKFYTLLPAKIVSPSTVDPLTLNSIFTINVNDINDPVFKYQNTVVVKTKSYDIKVKYRGYDLPIKKTSSGFKITGVPQDGREITVILTSNPENSLVKVGQRIDYYKFKMQNSVSDNPYLDDTMITDIKLATTRPMFRVDLLNGKYVKSKKIIGYCRRNVTYKGLSSDGNILIYTSNKLAIAGICTQ
jgi:hypothetical protein